MISSATASPVSLNLAAAGSTPPPPAPAPQPPANGSLADARQAVQTLSTIKTSTKDADKAAAEQKLSQLRDELKTLIMMGGDPKSVAKQAAQIARQIAAAAQAYAQAGGDPGPSVTAAPASAAAANSSAVLA